MSIYSTVESGTKQYRSRFHKSISFSKKFDCRFGEAIPVLAKFVLPGDVWRIGGQALVRFQPMQTPSLTPCYMKVRYFFVPLRLLDSNTELILTGSKDGHLYSGTLPDFPNLFYGANKINFPDCYKIKKYSFWDYLGCQIGDYENFATDSCLPAQYWNKAYLRIRYDYYDDENIGVIHNTYPDFETFYADTQKQGADVNIFGVALPKDYFTSSLPWQLKGVAPTITLGIGSVDFTNCFDLNNYSDQAFPVGVRDVPEKLVAGTVVGNKISDAGISFTQNALNALNKAQVSLSGSLDADDIRTMFAETRIFERLARSGSRYTEFLRSNFGTAPADDTMQRAQYLGGWKLPIVTTEVLQTAADGPNPVGTMRGHGITNGGNNISTFYAKEFGVIFGIAHFLPQIEYTQGCPKEFSYKSRFDFFNPSFQHLSEQEIRKGEIFIGSDGENDNTFGFQAYANELRSSVNMTVGDFRDTLKAWTQSIDYGNTRPNLNFAFINSFSYLANFNKCFAVTSTTHRPILCQFYNDLDVYRPMVKYSTPGLVDHL